MLDIDDAIAGGLSTCCCCVEGAAKHLGACLRASHPPPPCCRRTSTALLDHPSTRSRLLFRRFRALDHQRRRGRRVCGARVRADARGGDQDGRAGADWAVPTGAAPAIHRLPGTALPADCLSFSLPCFRSSRNPRRSTFTWSPTPRSWSLARRARSRPTRPRRCACWLLFVQLRCMRDARLHSPTMPRARCSPGPPLTLHYPDPCCPLPCHPSLLLPPARSAPTSTRSTSGTCWACPCTRSLSAPSAWVSGEERQLGCVLQRSAAQLGLGLPLLMPLP